MCAGKLLEESPHQFVLKVTEGWSLLRIMLCAVKDHLKPTQRKHRIGQNSGAAMYINIVITETPLRLVKHLSFLKQATEPQSKLRGKTDHINHITYVNSFHWLHCHHTYLHSFSNYCWPAMRGVAYAKISSKVVSLTPAHAGYSAIRDGNDCAILSSSLTLLSDLAHDIV
jgi:hypothetical protein